MDDAKQNKIDNLHDSLRFISNALNKHKAIIILLGTVFMAVAPFFFRFTFPSLVFEDPSYMDVIILGVAAVILVLSVMMVPACIGYVFIYARQNRQDKDRTILCNENTKKVILDFYLPIFIFTALIPFSLYLEYHNYHREIFWALYLLIILLYPVVRPHLDRIKLSIPTADKKAKKIPGIIDVYLEKSLGLFVLSSLSLFMIIFIIDLNDPEYFIATPHYLTKIFLFGILFLMPSMFFLLKPTKLMFFLACVIGIYIIIFFIDTYDAIISRALETRHIANYKQSLIFDRKTCDALKKMNIQIDKTNGDTCVILNTYKIKNNLGKEQVTLEISNTSLGKTEAVIKKEHILYQMNYLPITLKQKNLDTLVRSFSLINKLTNFSVTISSSSTNDSLSSTFNAKDKEGQQLILIHNKESRGLQLGLLLMLTHNLVSLDDKAYDYLPDAEKQSFSELLSHKESEYFPLLRKLLSAPLGKEPGEAYKKVFSSMQIVNPETPHETLSINQEDLSHLFGHINTNTTTINQLINSGYFNKSTFKKNDISTITSNYNKNHVMAFYNGENHYTIVMSVVDNEFDMTLNNPKIQHFLEALMSNTD